jgi:hypothetical protein
MAGNEVTVCKFIFLNSQQINLKHLGQVKIIAAPAKGANIPLKVLEDVNNISTSDPRKKADIYINDRGVSIKQTGASVLFNRLQRANLSKVYCDLEISEINNKIIKLDHKVAQFHEGEILRDQPWQDFFWAAEFKRLLSFLMLEGSPNYGLSTHRAEFILEAPTQIQSTTEIQIYTFDEYFEKYKNNIRIAIRRSWIGQLSTSEHTRAKSIAKKVDNLPWVFDNIITEPPKGWREDVKISNRKTVYYLMILKVN